MDKYEYQVCAEQIKTLINERRYTEAMNIADTIDWRKVRSVAMLCTVSEVYKINKKYEEARDILLLAYDRYPGGRTIVYALCELAIKLNDVIQAKELYEEFVRLAPEDTSRYILLYKLYEALDVSIEERIEVLEEFKKTDYRERWAYELAYLYHKIGQETKCVQECDELILWFGDGKYVKQAMDLKMQHTRLSKEQQLKYEGRQEPMSDKFMSMQQTPVQQIYDTDPQAGNPQQIPMQPPYETRYTGSFMTPPVQDSQPLFIQEPVSMQGRDMQITAEPVSSAAQRTAQMLNTSEIDSIQVQPVNVGMYNTMDLQNGLSENIRKFFERENAQALDENVRLSADPGSYEKLYERNTMEIPSGTDEIVVNDGSGPVISVRELNPSENELDDVPGKEEDVQITTFMPASSEVNASMQYYGAPADTGEMNTEEPALSPNEEEAAVMEAVRAHDERRDYAAADLEDLSADIVEDAEAESGEETLPEADTEEADTEEAADEEDAEASAEADEDEAEEDTAGSKEEDKQAEADPVSDEAPAEAKEDKPAAVKLPDDDEIYGDDLDSIYKSWEDKKRESEEKRIQEAKEKSLVWTTDIMAQLKGVLPEIDDIAKPTPPRVVTSVDTGEMPSVEPVFKPYSTTSPDREIKPASISIPLPVDEIEQEMQDFAKKSEESEEEEKTGEDTEGLEDLPEDTEEAEDTEDTDDESEGESEDTEDMGDESEDEDEDTEDMDDESEDEDEDTEDMDDESEDEEEDEEDTGDDSEDEDDEDETGDDTEDEALPDEDGSEEEEQQESSADEASETDEEVDYSTMEISYDPHDDMGFEPEKLDVSVTKSDLSNTDPGNDIYFREIMNMDDSDEESDDASGMNEDAADGELTYSEDEEAARKAAFEITSELPEYPYESLEDYGEVEEIEVIEQPEGIDGIMKTNDLPLDDIARANYEAGIEPEEDDESEEPKAHSSKKKKHPSYMKLEKAPVSKREFDKEEQLVFGRFEGIEWLKAQIVNCIDNIDMDPSRGNVLVMGTEASGRRSIAIDVVKVMQSLEDGFKGKVAKISGEALNKKDIPLTIKKLRHGALIVENSEGLTPSSARIVAEALELETEPVLVVMEGDTGGVTKLINTSRDIFDRVFNSRIELQDFTTDDLVAYGKGYAHEKEYTIDDMGVLALYRRIGDMQTLEHIVTLEEVREIVDNAIKHVDKKNMSHFMDVLLAKRYDDDDYIILREKDFIV